MQGQQPSVCPEMWPIPRLRSEGEKAPMAGPGSGTEQAQNIPAQMGEGVPPGFIDFWEVWGAGGRVLETLRAEPALFFMEWETGRGREEDSLSKVTQ